MKKRPPKSTDQDNIEKAYQIITKVMRKYPEFEGTIWAGAIWSTLVNGYIRCGNSYDEFCKEIEGVKVCYKSWWNEK